MGMDRLGARHVSGLDVAGLPRDGRVALRRVLHVVCYKSRRPAQEPLRCRLRELALVRVSYGHKRLRVLLRREGWAINHERTRRLYREEGLQLGRYRGPKRRKRVGAGRGRPVRTPADQPSVRWAMDVVHDQTASGTTFRVLTVIDVYSWECVARSNSMGGPPPTTIQCDQGTEFTSMAMDAWAYWQHIPLDLSRRGTPGDNAMNEAFNGSFRRECLSQQHFMSVEDAQQIVAAWRDEYNNERPTAVCRISLQLNSEREKTSPQIDPCGFPDIQPGPWSGLRATSMPGTRIDSGRPR